MTNFCNPTRCTYFVEIKIPQSFEDWVAVRNIRQGSCQPQENFSQTNKSWSTAFYPDSSINEKCSKV